MKLEGKALEDYWAEALQHRMESDWELDRLASVLKGFYVEQLRYYGGTLPIDEEDYVKELQEFHGSKRPYGNKDVAASIAYNLGWDYRRQLCYNAVPDVVKGEADKLHKALYDYLTRWL